MTEREAADWGGREVWHPGDVAFFEYHCLESDASEDAETWYHSHRAVTVLAPNVDDDGWNWAGWSHEERAREGVPRSYLVRHADGYEHTAFEDELLTGPEFFWRPDPPGRHG